MCQALLQTATMQLHSTHKWSNTEQGKEMTKICQLNQTILDPTLPILMDAVNLK